MSWLEIMFTLFVFISLAQLIHGIMAQRKIKKLKAEENQKHAEMLEAWSKLEVAVNKLKIDAVELQSLKRWMRGTMQHLQEHGDKMEELFGAMQPEAKPLDLDEIDEH